MPAIALSLVAMLIISAHNALAQDDALDNSNAPGANAPARGPEPYFVNLQGENITVVEAGQQFMIMNTFVNSHQTPKDFLGIVEVRDSNGVSIFIAWQTGTMPPANANTGEYGENTAGVSWLATKPGEYQVRAFTVTGFVNTQILSIVQQTEITVR